MVKINKIYTRTGDDGTTGLVGGRRTSKDALRVCAYGEIDEVNSQIGLVSAVAEKNGARSLLLSLSLIQNELFDIGAVLATPPGAQRKGLPTISQTSVKRMEDWIDAYTSTLPELRSFVLPGGPLLTAHLHVARTVCRRAERAITTLSRHETVPAIIRIYVNRLSDLLFAMARHSTSLLKAKEILWIPGGKRPTLVRGRDSINSSAMGKHKRSTKKARPPGARTRSKK